MGAGMGREIEEGGWMERGTEEGILRGTASRH